MSKVIAILNAAERALTVPPIDGVVVSRQRNYARQVTTPTINVRLGRKAPPELKTGATMNGGIADRTTELLVIIVAKGDDSLEQVERLHGEVVRRLFADTRLGGSCIDFADMGAQRDESDTDGQIEMLTAVFHVKYRTVGDEI
ncbi:MAG: hypothetical protein FWC38_00735 [Proteobacteria bacterium]|nr:hypothetical protein [Pseudomonadota bacterium]MCL2306768.1 hypothetical protein [Pseudomonadota bacterium]